MTGPVWTKDQGELLLQQLLLVLGFASCCGEWVVRLFAVSSPEESYGRAGRSEVRGLSLCGPASAAATARLMVLQYKSRRAGSIPVPIRCGGWYWPGKVVLTAALLNAFSIASPCRVWGLGFCIFVNKLKIHSGTQILLNDVWVAS